jgi:hypothetical protein
MLPSTMVPISLAKTMFPHSSCAQLELITSPLPECALAQLDLTTPPSFKCALAQLELTTPPSPRSIPMQQPQQQKFVRKRQQLMAGLWFMV